MDLKDQYGNIVWVGMMVAMNLTMTVSLNLLLWAAYRSEHKFFKSRKILNRPWPWE
jgi:hypothetical protein